MKVLIDIVEYKDLPEILALQYIAFCKEAKEFDDPNMEPMKQTLKELKEEFSTFTFLKASKNDGEIIGSIRGYSTNASSFLGKTFVHPDFQGQGIGTKMIIEMEKRIPSQRYEINASIRRPQNIKLYERLGYKRFKEIETEDNTFVYLEKFE